MDSAVQQDALKECVTSMVALETRLEGMLAWPPEQLEGYLETPTLVGRLRSLAAEQREAIQARLEQLGESDLPPLRPTIAAGFELPTAPEGRAQASGAIAALRAIALALNETAVSYAVLHGLAHRSADFATAELADEHRRSYLDAVRSVHWAIGDVVLQELKQAGYACHCQCPLCGPGICNCSHIHTESEVIAPEPPLGGIVLRQPRAGSNAEQAGLHEGDVVTAVDGEPVRSYEAMLARMRAHQPGEEVSLRVRRRAGHSEDVMITR
ncbi:MAG: PDZ domain-containing protein [Chloroflexi bacterium]|nr:PDZ domain-containing protein [Chloroflexota bacterium]